MTRHERIAELERRATTDPAGYRRRLLLVGALGYAAIGGMVTAAVAGATYCGFLAATVGLDDGGFVAFILLVALSGILLRSIFVRQQRPEGVPLARADAPRLYEWIDELAPRLHAPRVHRVLLSHDFNAAVMQRGRTNELVVGLPLLCVLTATQLQGVIAHELGHLSTGDGRLSAWIYYLRLRWERVRERLADPPARWLLAPIIHGYLPWFDVWSFVQARAQERLADRGEVAVVGGQTAARTHAKLALVTNWYVHRFLPDLVEAALDEGGRLTDQASRTLAALQVPVPARRLEWWLAEARRVPADDEDTHPPTGERMETAAPGYTPRFEGLVPDETAAQAILGEALGDWVARLDAEPDVETAALWAAQRDRLGEAREGRRRTRSRGLLERWAQARDREIADGSGPAAPLFEKLIARDPDFAPAHDRLGRHLLGLGDDAGLAHLERAMALDSAMAPDPAMYAADVLRAAGREEDASAWERRAAEAAASLWLGPLDARCTPVPHRVPPRMRDAIVERTDAMPELARAHLIGLKPPEGPPATVLALSVRWRLFVNVDAVYDRLAGYLEDVWIPGRFEVVDTDDPDWRWLRAACDAKGERLR